MKHLKLFEMHKPEEEEDSHDAEENQPLVDAVGLPREDPSLIPGVDYKPTPEVRARIKSKIDLLERDPKFQEIMDMIESGKIKKAVKVTTRNFFRLDPSLKLQLLDDRIIKIGVIKSWEDSRGNYDHNYVIYVDDGRGGAIQAVPLGYISFKNYTTALKAVENFNEF